ncbi:uncharacterized protein LOC121252166 [Juglans microcarpa x Juglans regia]|uniref:uncharacterized protein LOC121252166 n=1 Tax=Juglans microcarpa x Juglans regia TaxID=2249226 RepID=UPI001B7E0D4C|nr:uncharacterized protein LOC121252166 [Juglans microcarpa x Juglans regia]
MNENTGDASSSLAITTEKRTHRPGGCVGIFLQLFDWNRRFAKKKLFSKKLLPPVRAKKASSKFKGDEKMPISKLHLIADENSGGFPNVKKTGNRRLDLEKKNEMRTPGLVARLMGLESMPTVHRDKPKKPSFSDKYGIEEEKFVASHGGLYKEELNRDEGGTKQESRPQKLRKTGLFEGQTVTRFGAEALQIKSVLSRSRKHHHYHPKLASPVKSSRISSGRNVPRSSRLIGAATKILEPGLQATNRAKCALAYSSSLYHSPKDEMETERTWFMSPDTLEQPSYNGGLAHPLMGQTSCTNCGNLVALGPNAEEKPSAFFASNVVASQDSGWSKPRPPESSHEQEREAFFLRSKDQVVPLVAKAKDNLQDNNDPITERVPLSHEDQRQLQLLSHTCKPQGDKTSSMAFKQKVQTVDRMLLGRDKIPPRSKLSNLQSRRVSSAGNAATGTKDFVTLNRSLTGRTRPRVISKVDTSGFDTVKKVCNGQDESLPQLRTPVRKRRTINASGQTESTGFVSSTIAKERNVWTDTSNGKCMGLNAQSMNQNIVSGRLAGRGDGERADGNKETDVISFTFNSSARHKTGIPAKIEEKMRDENGKIPFQRPLPLTRDALGVLLEQKWKELTRQEDEELINGAPVKTSAAIILQELISAFTAEQPCSQDGHMFNKDIAFKTKAEIDGLVGSSCQSHHLSPGSVLEASFSSSSLDESPVPRHRLCPDLMDYSYNQLQPLAPDAGFWDSATSSNKGMESRQMVVDYVRHVSKILDILNLTGPGLTGIKVAQAKEVILNAELLFGNATPHTFDGMKGFLISPHLLDGMESFGRTAWTNYIGFIGLEDTKERNHLRTFLFDLIVECLDSKYGQYCNSGFKTWSRLPLHMGTEKLTLDAAEEVRRWTDLAGMIPDEIIELEMSHSLRKWTDFDTEAFETGAEIDGDILQILIEEIVMDLLDGRPGSF